MKTRSTLLSTLAIATILTVSACSGPTDSVESDSQAPSSSSALLAEHGLEGLDGKEIIDTLDAMPVADRPTDLRASIRPDELLLSGGSGEDLAVALPEDEFYVSFAPYVDTTHDCYFHSLTTCTAELGGQDIEVKVVSSTGEVIVDETRQAFDNGFVGLWLPRDIEAELSVEYNGLKASTPISTVASDDPTCLTTLQLS